MEQAQAPVVANAQPTGPQGPQGNLPAPDPSILSPIVLEHMDELEQMRSLLDGKLGDAYDRVLTAGMKLMYSADNSQMMQQIIMDEQIPVANKLGEGIANLLVMMDNQGNGTIPKEVLVPVGVALMFEAADYLFEVGIEFTENDLGGALELLIRSILVGYGLDPSKIDNVIDDMGKKLGFDETEQGKKVAEMPDAKEEVTPVSNNEEEAFQQGFEAETTKREGM
jgi:hypothetical protein